MNINTRIVHGYIGAGALLLRSVLYMPEKMVDLVDSNAPTPTGKNLPATIGKVYLALFFINSAWFYYDKLWKWATDQDDDQERAEGNVDAETALAFKVICIIALIAMLTGPALYNLYKSPVVQKYLPIVENLVTRGLLPVIFSGMVYYNIYKLFTEGCKPSLVYNTLNKGFSVVDFYCVDLALKKGEPRVFIALHAIRAGLLGGECLSLAAESATEMLD